MLSVFKTKKAFTLLEMIVVIFITLILITGATQLMMAGNKNISIMWEQLSTQSQANFAVNRFIDYARTAEVSSIGAYPIEVASPYSLVFYANVDSDSLIEKVKFWLDSNDNTLKQSIVKPAVVLGQPTYQIAGGATEKILQLAKDVSNYGSSKPLFLYYNQYYNGSGNALINYSISDVRMIKMQLELEKDANKSPVPLTVESTVLVRSLHNN